MELKGYFDYAASAPPFDESLDVFKNTSMHYFGNPSSNHNYGLSARELLKSSKKKFLKIACADKSSIILTSGGSESNNMVLNSMLDNCSGKKVLIAVDSHPSSYYITKNFPEKSDVLNIDSHGQINLDTLDKLLLNGYSLLSLVHANNETGVIKKNIDKIIEICKRKNVLIHIDGVQVIGHMPININDYKGVFYVFSSHKFGAPRGSGGIITGSPELLNSIITGGSQEDKLRAGTENLASFAAAVKALEISLDSIQQRMIILKEFSEFIKHEVMSAFPQTIMNSQDDGLPGLVSFSIPGIKGSVTVAEMALFGYAISSGSACHSSLEIPPHVITAMGRDIKTAFGTLRISMGYHTEMKEVQNMVKTLVRVIQRQLNE